MIVECQTFLLLESAWIHPGYWKGSYLTSITNCPLSPSGQCASKPFQLHDSILSSGVLLTLIILWEEQYCLPEVWLLGCINSAAVAYWYCPEFSFPGDKTSVSLGTWTLFAKLYHRHCLCKEMEGMGVACWDVSLQGTEAGQVAVWIAWKICLWLNTKGFSFRKLRFYLKKKKKFHAISLMFFP